MATAKKAPTKTTRSLRAQTQAAEGPRYRLLKDSIIDNALQPVGKEVTYYGEPGSALYPVNDEAKRRKIAVRDIRRNQKLDADEKLAALRELSDQWNGVEAADEFAESDEFDDELPVGERAELERHAQQTVADTAAANADNTNKVSVQLQGDPSDPEGKQSKDGLQGHTPVLDKGKAK